MTVADVTAADAAPPPERVILAVVAAYAPAFVAFGVLVDGPARVLHGLLDIVLTRDALLTDYFGVGGIGAACVNAGLLTLIVCGVKSPPRATNQMDVLQQSASRDYVPVLFFMTASRIAVPSSLACSPYSGNSFMVWAPTEAIIDPGLLQSRPLGKTIKCFQGLLAAVCRLRDNKTAHLVNERPPPVPLRTGILPDAEITPCNASVDHIFHQT